MLHYVYNMRIMEDKRDETIKALTEQVASLKEEVARLTAMSGLPTAVAQQLTSNPNIIIADKFDNTTILFTDIVGFTNLSGGMSAGQVVTMLNDLFTLFDMRAEAEGIEKIKTIGDAYMAVAGLHGGTVQENAVAMIQFARGLKQDLDVFNETCGLDIKIRIGLNTGKIVAGVIGKTKFIYDVWGDSVNVASRMESTGSPGVIHVSESTFLAARGISDSIKFAGPDQVQVKGKGEMHTYYVKDEAG